MEINSLAGYFFEIRDVVFFWVWEEGGEKRRRRRGDNIPCNSLLDVVNLPCVTSHSNASKLDAMFVDQCFIQCLLA